MGKLSKAEAAERQKLREVEKSAYEDALKAMPLSVAKKGDRVLALHRSVVSCLLHAVCCATHLYLHLFESQGHRTVVCSSGGED